MGRRTDIPQEDLVRVAHALASGRRQTEVAKDFGWDKNTMRRCVERFGSELLSEGEPRYSLTAMGKALEWLRLRKFCTSEELVKAKAMARQNALEDLEQTLRCGELDRKFGRPDIAERRYLAHLRDDAGNVEVLVRLGFCLLDLGRLDDALARFESVLVATPEHADARCGKAVALENTGRRREALEELEEARRHAPDDVYMMALHGNWRMKIALDKDGLDMLYVATRTLVREYSGKEGLSGYCCKVVEVVLAAYRDRDLLNEAIIVAREAQQHGWNTEYIADTLKVCEEKKKARPPIDLDPMPYLFRVLVMAYAKDPPPGHWPEEVAGYQLKLDVLAHHPQDAGKAALQYMVKVEPTAVQFHIDVQYHGERRRAIDGSFVTVSGEPLWILRDGSTATGAPARESVSRPRTQKRRRTQAPVRRPVGGHRRG